MKSKTRYYTKRDTSRSVTFDFTSIQQDSTKDVTFDVFATALSGDVMFNFPEVDFWMDNSAPDKLQEGQTLVCAFTRHRDGDSYSLLGSLQGVYGGE